MPATAGRVRMPANNRVHSSAALQTHGIWQSAIGYDPYAPASKEDGSKPGSSKPDSAAENAYVSFQGLLTLARITGTNTNETRGACKKCGRIGHLTYQCRNFLTLKNDAGGDASQNYDSALQAATKLLDKINKGSGVIDMKEECGSEEEDDDEDEELSSTSDSDVDPEIERIIAERYGKSFSRKVHSLSKKREGEEEENRKKRRHGHKKRRSGHHRRHHQHHHHHRRSDSDSDDGSESDRRHRRHGRRSRRASNSDTDSTGESLDWHRKRSNKHQTRRHRERKSVLSSGSESTASSSYDDQRRERREKKRSRRREGKDRN